MRKGYSARLRGIDDDRPVVAVGKVRMGCQGHIEQQRLYVLNKLIALMDDLYGKGYICLGGHAGKVEPKSQNTRRKLQRAQLIDRQQ